jgi:hypothetical protein
MVLCDRKSTCERHLRKHTSYDLPTSLTYHTYGMVQNLPPLPAFKTCISLKDDLLKPCLTATVRTGSGYCTDNCNKDSLIISHVLICCNQPREPHLDPTQWVLDNVFVMTQKAPVCQSLLIIEVSQSHLVKCTTQANSCRPTPWTGLPLELAEIILTT